MISERRVETELASTRYLEVDGPDAKRPVLFLHGNPSSADGWIAFLNALEGSRRCIAPDQIGFGESDRIPGFKHTMDSMASYLLDVLDTLEIERFDLVVHDWGAIGLIAAMQRPQQIGRIVVINTVPLFADYRWHWVARYFWRRRFLGELFNATTSRSAVELVMRRATPTHEAIPGVVDEFWPYFDTGMKRAILELYRDAEPAKLGELGRNLGKLGGPSLVLWGDADPYIEPRFGDSFGQALGAKVEHLADAGHWPWIDRPDAIERIAGFLTR